MATPTLSTHRLPGVLGELLVDVRAGGRQSARPAVLIIHGFKGFKDWGMFPPLAERLARAGFTAVSFNLSGSGVDDRGDFAWPDRFGRNTYGAELRDVATVVEALARGELDVAPPSSLGVVGHSRGGGIAVLYAAGEPRVRALVTWAAIATVCRWSKEERARWRERGTHEVVNARTGQVLPLGIDLLDEIEREAEGALDIVAAARRVRIPWLVAHGTADEAVPVDDADELAAAAPADTTRLLRVDGAGHTFGAVHPWKGSTPALDQVMEETVGWLARHLA